MCVCHGVTHVTLAADCQLVWSTTKVVFSCVPQGHVSSDGPQ